MGFFQTANLKSANLNKTSKCVLDVMDLNRMSGNFVGFKFCGFHVILFTILHTQSKIYRFCTTKIKQPPEQ